MMKQIYKDIIQYLIDIAKSIETKNEYWQGFADGFYSAAKEVESLAPREHPIMKALSSDRKKRAIRRDIRRERIDKELFEDDDK